MTTSLAAQNKTQMDSVVRVKNLALERNGRVLFSGLDLDLPPGTWMFLTGPSGVGKSSFLAALAGQLKPAQGEIRVLGRDPLVNANGVCDEALRGRIGFVFQNLLLTPHNSALENTLTGRLNRHSWVRTLFSFPAEERTEAARLLEQLGLGRDVHRPVRLLSGGQQQRVAIARTLFQQPRVVLADEPVSGLDKALARETFRCLKTYAQKTGAVVVCSTHDLSWVPEFGSGLLRFTGEADKSWTFEHA